MNFKPILFSGPMVKALLDGTKTQTRRVVKKELPIDAHGFNFLDSKSYMNQDKWLEKRGLADTWSYFVDPEHGSYPCDDKEKFKCPYGVPGDVLWVREKFAYVEEWDEIGQKFNYFYAADYEDMFLSYKPSIHMPKEACRLFLRVKSVKIERLNDITENDAIAEGVERITQNGMMSYRSYAVKNDAAVFPYVSFKTLWQKIHGADSWEINPWVWVVEFEKIKKPKSFI